MQVGMGLRQEGAGFESAVAQMMNNHWQPEGYAAPNAVVYPWQWLWDSCFHVLIWLSLKNVERAQAELAQLFGPQLPSGFVPHINYVRQPGFHRELWGSDLGSSLTQPPMYGHAVAALCRAEQAPPARVIEAAEAGLWFLLNDRRRDAAGLVLLAHPWESGADNSPRWDDFCPGGFAENQWVDEKNRLVSTVERGPDGAALANPEFVVGSVGFNALVAFNAREMATVTGDESMAEAANQLVAALDLRWVEPLATWVDTGAAVEGSGRCRTADALLPLLVTEDASVAAQALAQLVNPMALGSEFGLCGVHRGEPVFDPAAYWRGPLWPQLAYLLTLAASRFDALVAQRLQVATRRGAQCSGLAEYWHPDSGQGLGAIPQSWAGLALVEVV